MKHENVLIFDTTLRDGLQPVERNIFPYERLDIARNLAAMGVDIIEAGFPCSSAGNSRSVELIAQEVGTKDGPVIAGLSRANVSDIQAAAKAVEEAYKPRIHTFIATSDIHIEHKFGKDRDWVIEQTDRSVREARKYVDDVQFSLEDFGRSDPDFSYQVVRQAIAAGAGTINLPDTVGYMMPEEYGSRIRDIIERARGDGYDAVFAVHTHNDLGLATANTLAGLQAGARQAEVAVNGIGERAGNSSLEEIVAVLRTRPIDDRDGVRLDTEVDTSYMGQVSSQVASYTDMQVQPNKAVIGKNAFAHSSGIHQHGFLRERETYEIMKPEDYGMSSYVGQSAQSGRAGHKDRFDRIGVAFDSEEDFHAASARYTDIADSVRKTDDADFIRAVTGDEEVPVHYQLATYHPVIESSSGEESLVGVVVKLYEGDTMHKAFEEGNGQVDAAVTAIKGIIGREYTIQDFHVGAGGAGSDASGGAEVVVTKNGWEVTGHGQSTDIVKSGIQAYIDGCNRLRYIDEYFA